MEKNHLKFDEATAAKFEPGKTYYENWMDVDEIDCYGRFRREFYECVRRSDSFVWIKDKNGTVKRSKIEHDCYNDEITYTKFDGIQCNIRARYTL